MRKRIISDAGDRTWKKSAYARFGYNDWGFSDKIDVELTKIEHDPEGYSRASSTATYLRHKRQLMDEEAYLLEVKDTKTGRGFTCIVNKYKGIVGDCEMIGEGVDI